MEVSESLMDALKRKLSKSRERAMSRMVARGCHFCLRRAATAEYLENILVFSLHGSYSLEARWYAFSYFWPSH